MKNRLFWVGLLLAGISSGVSAEIYKWKDASGRVRYSDLPPVGNIPYETLSGARSSGAAAPAAAPAAKTDAEKARDALKRQMDAAEAKKKEDQQAAEEKQREQNCMIAKSNLQNYQQGGRIYRMNEKGEREYLDDAAIAKGLEQAKKDVEEYCKE